MGSLLDPGRGVTSLRSRRLHVDEWLRDLQLRAISAGASCWMVDCQLGERVAVAGVVRRLRLEPVEGRTRIFIDDGTDIGVACFDGTDPKVWSRSSPGAFVLIDAVALERRHAMLMLEASSVLGMGSDARFLR